MKILFISLTAIAVIIGFVLFTYRHSRYTEREERINIEAWRKGLQRGDLVNVRGMVHRIEALHPKGVVELFRYSEENSFATLGEFWPVE